MVINKQQFINAINWLEANNIPVNAQTVATFFKAKAEADRIFKECGIL